MSLLDAIPAEMRKKPEIMSQEELRSLLLNSDEFRAMPLAKQIRFLHGWRDHLKNVEDTENKYFPITLHRVETFARQSKSGQTVGVKATLVGENKQGEEERIDTGWLDFIAPEEYVFEIALARTLFDIAKANVGRVILVQKRLGRRKDGGNAFRELLDIVDKEASGKPYTSVSPGQVFDTPAPGVGQPRPRQDRGDEVTSEMFAGRVGELLSQKITPDQDDMNMIGELSRAVVDEGMDPGRALTSVLGGMGYQVVPASGASAAEIIAGSFLATVYSG